MSGPWVNPNDQRIFDEHRQFLDKLTPRQRLILVSRFLDPRSTLEQVSLILDLKKERIRQIQVYALRRLKVFARAAEPREPEPAAPEYLTKTGLHDLSLKLEIDQVLAERAFSFLLRHRSELSLIAKGPAITVRSLIDSPALDLRTLRKIRGIGPVIAQLILQLVAALRAEQKQS